MRAAVLEEYGKPLKIVDIDRPRAEGSSVVIKVSGCGICHSDIHLWRGEFSSILPADLPIVPGHEASGVVVDVGDNVPPDIYPGLKVLVYWSYCEQDDRYSEVGMYQHCSMKAPAGFLLYNGCYAEYMLVPHYRYLVPAEGLEDLSSAAILSCAGATAYNAVKRAVSHGVGEDEYIAIVGLGGLGVLAFQLARRLTGSRIVGVDVRREAVEKALEVLEPFEGDSIVDASRSDPRRSILEATGGKDVKVVLDFVGSRGSIETYMDLLAPRGLYVIVGLGSAYGPSIPVHHMVIRELSISSVFYGSIHDLRSVVDLARRKVINYRGFTTKITLDRVNEAIENLHRGRVVGRQVIEF